MKWFNIITSLFLTFFLHKKQKKQQKAKEKLLDFSLNIFI